MIHTVCLQILDIDPHIDQELLMQFDKAPLGGPKALPAREAAIVAARQPKEELGLYVEPQALLGLNSLFKMEQRLTKARTLDKATLVQLAGTADDEAAAQAAAVQRKHAADAVAQQQKQQQQLVVGALPSLAEEPDESAGATGAQTHEQPMPAAPEAQQLKPAVLGAAPSSNHVAPPQAQLPQLITDPNTAWQALQHHQQVLMQMGAFDPNHPNHGFLASVQQALQQMAAGGPLPLIGLDGMPLPPEEAAKLVKASQNPWLDENGLMKYLPDPVKPDKERPARRFDQVCSSLSEAF